MRRYLPWVAAAACGAIALTIAGALLVLYRYDYNDLRPWIVETVRQATGRELTIGELRLELGLSPAVVAKDLRLGNPDWASRPDMATVSSLELEISLRQLFRGRVAIDRLVLVEPDLLIETNSSGEDNLSFKRRAQPSGDLHGTNASDLDVGRLVIRDGRLALRDGRTGAQRDFALKALSIEKISDSKVGFTIEGAYGAAALSGVGKAGPLRAFLEQDTSLELDFEAEVEGTAFTIQGTIADFRRLASLEGAGLDLRIGGQSKDPSLTAAALGFTLPFTKHATLRLELTDPAVRMLRVSGLDIESEGMRLGGALDLDLSGKRPAFRGALEATALDLRRWAPAQTGQAKRKEKTARRIFPAQALPFDALAKVDARVTINAGELRLQSLTIEPFKAEVRLERGVLDFPVEGVAGGGRLMAALSVDTRAARPKARVALNLARGRLAEMLKGTSLESSMDGMLDLELDLAGQGKSVAELLSTADGTVLLVMGQGQVENRHIDMLGGNLAEQLLRLFNPGRKARETRIDCLVNRFAVSRGMARCTALVVDTPGLSLAGEGLVDLRSEAIEMRFTPAPKQGLGVQGIGSFSLSMTELAKPLKLEGTLAEPTLGVDLGRTAWTIGKAAGGVALFGPVGVLGALAGGTLGQQENPCLAALEQIEAERCGTTEPRRKGFLGRIRGIFD
jgi:AsmA family protein